MTRNTATADGPDQVIVHPPDRPTRLPSGGPNAVGFTLGLLSDEWNLLILRYAIQGARRYADWRDALPISHAVLTRRLATLTDMGVFERVRYQAGNRRLAYTLTKRGRDLWPVLLTIWAWEAAWVPVHVERLPRMVHQGCGQEFTPVLTCGACGRPVEPRDVAGAFGPSGSWPRSVPASSTRRRSESATGAGMFPETMTLIGNRWSAAILGAAFLGAHRFRDFAQWLGAPPATVAARLRTFCELGVFAQQPSPERSDRHRYRLTKKGRAFFPVAMTALAWGQRWFRAPEGPALVFTHRGCGQDFHARLACDRCSSVLRGAEVIVDGRA